MAACDFPGVYITPRTSEPAPVILQDRTWLLRCHRPTLPVIKPASLSVALFGSVMCLCHMSPQWWRVVAAPVWAAVQRHMHFRTRNPSGLFRSETLYLSQSRFFNKVTTSSQTLRKRQKWLLMGQRTWTFQDAHRRSLAPIAIFSLFFNPTSSKPDSASAVQLPADQSGAEKEKCCRCRLSTSPLGLGGGDRRTSKSSSQSPWLPRGRQPCRWKQGLLPPRRQRCQRD